MAELVRVSSIDALYRSLNSPQCAQLDLRGEAAALVQLWWRRRARLVRTRRSIQSQRDQVDYVMTGIALLISGISFEDAQAIVVENTFNQALSQLLLTLPHDPALSKNNSKVRSVRFISSAFMIREFSRVILTYSKDYNLADVVIDECLEAKLCKNAASMVYSCFVHLLVAADSPLQAFRAALISYRFAVRYFFEAMSSWRKVDSDRLVVSLQKPYIEIYSMLMALERQGPGASSSSEFEDTRAQARQHLTRIERMFSDVLGARGSSIVEELIAYCRSFESAHDAHDHADSSALASYPSRSIATSAAPRQVPFSEDFIFAVESVVMSNLEFEFAESDQRLVSALVNVTSAPLDQIMYEVCVYGRYSEKPLGPRAAFALYTYDQPTDAAQEESVAQSPSDRLKRHLRRDMLRYMGDKLVVSLRGSSVASLAEVVKGARVVVALTERHPDRPNEADVASAEVLAVNDSSVTVRFLTGQPEDVALSRVVLASDGIFATPFLDALADLCSRMLALTPNARPAMATELDRAVDVPLLRQMISNNAIGAADMASTFVYLLDKICSLQAPVNTEHTLRWKQELLLWLDTAQSMSEFVACVPAFFEFCSGCIDEIRADMTNFYVRTLAPALSKAGPTYLRTFFCINARMGLVSLDRTAAWLQVASSPDKVAELQAVGIVATYDALLGLVRESDQATQSYFTALAFTLLLQSSFRLDSVQNASQLPETVIRDATALSLIRDEMDTLALLSTVLIVVKQTLARLRLQLRPEEEAEIQSRLVAVVRSATVVLSDICAEGVRFVRECVARQGVAAGKEWEDGMRKAISDTVAEDNVVRNLFSKRIIKLILSALVDKPFQDLLPIYSLSSPQQVKMLSSIIASTKRVYVLNVRTFGAFYDLIYKYCV